ncbi:MAG: nicotinamide-nucleotide amidase [Acidobacteriota bacterium]|jgi:nicotinamide-nucleotide amidase
MAGVSAAPLATAEIIAVGSELLGTTRIDTNSLFLAGRLASLGIELRAKTVVGDERARLAAVFDAALSRADLVVLTGGLGPTDDDVTRDVVAAALGLEMHEDAAIVAQIASRFARRSLRMPDVNRRQAMVPTGAVSLDNPNGTAPGLYLEHQGHVVVLLPGPPRELQPMFDALCAGPLLARAGEERLFREVLFVAGRGESHVEEIAQPRYSRWAADTPPIETTILAMPGQVELHLTLRARDAQAGAARVRAARDELAAALGDDVFSTDGRSMEEVVGAMLADRALTISAAESCTGGLILSRLTDVPGSSRYVLGGAVAYSNESKSALAGVPADLIAAHGAVSEEVAIALADGIRARTGSTLSLGVTGIAGPGGGSPQKPVGTVAIALTGANMGTRVRLFSFFGGRPQVKFQASQAALDMVRRALDG